MKHRESDGHVYGETPESKYFSEVIASWILSHPNRRFSLESLAKEIGCSSYYVLHALAKPEVSKYVRCSVEEFTQKKYQSIAPEIEPTIEGMIKMDNLLTQAADVLGRQAREEFYERQHNDYKYRRKRGLARKF